MILLVTLGIVLVGCAAGPGLTDTQPGAAGFWQGLWHGLIAPITFWVSLFNPGVSIYEVHNSGGWYDAGFLIGVSTVFGGIARSGSHASGIKARCGTRP
ncbi:MAG: hypothetical protein WAX29_10125 [Propionibacterium sp.]